MTKKEALEKMSQLMGEYRHKPYDFWKPRIGEDPIVIEHSSSSGREFRIEIDPIWDTEEGGNIRVLFSAYYGGLSSFSPPTHDFIITPDNTFLD